jgi:hypothetical protein
LKRVTIHHGAKAITNPDVNIAEIHLSASPIARNSALNAPLRFASRNSENTIANTEQNEHFDVLSHVLSVILSDSRRYGSLRGYLYSKAKNRRLNAQLEENY